MKFVPIETERLVVRPITPDDIEDLVDRRSDPSTAAYQAWTVPYSLERGRALVEECTVKGGPSPDSWYQVVVAERDTQRIVGDLAARLSDNSKTAEIGYTLHTWARGRGYATESSIALCEYLVRVEGVHRLEASTHPDNRASISVLERLGFKAEGIRRESYWVGDTVSDDAMFGLLARDWVPPVRKQL